MANLELEQLPPMKTAMLIRKPVAEVDGTTFVSITEAGFSGDGDEVLKQVTDSTGGFCWMLAGVKALMDHNVRLNLVSDRFPKGIEEH